MSQPCFPDPAASRAVLIGASHFTAAGPDLPDIPAVQANLTALRQVLTSPETGVPRPESCPVLADPTSADEVGRLHLALAHTHPHRARWSALPLELLREEIANSAAANRVLVLDCCFSGRAIEAMTDDQGVIGGQLEVAGTYTLTSTTANAPAHAPVGDQYTAFTGALLRALNHADPLTLDQIHGVIDRDLAARNLPRPQRRVINTAGDLALSRGPATRSHPERADSDAVRFTCSFTLPKVALPTFRSFVLSIGIILNVIGIILSGYVLFLVLCVGMLAVLVLPFASFVSQRRKAWVGELIVDRSGLTVQRKPMGAHLPWRDIAQVGVLQPERGALNHRLPVTQYMRTDVLVVRLRPEVPAPNVVSVLSDEHRQLGYFGLCTLESVGSSRQEMTGVLERFAGGKLVHSSRQFLDRDPRLRSEMV